MPYINVSVSRTLQPQQKEQIKARMGKLISLIPGKSESVTMVRIADGCALYMGGSALDNGAFIDIRLLGNATQQSKEALTKAMFQSMGKLLGVEPGDMYTNIIEFENWGYNGRLI
jgi:Macrophage migration inhibitory factor (MIF).